MVFLLFLCWVSVVLARSSTVSNVVPRRDATTGAILDVHDGTTLKINDTFYWYGAGYGGCKEMPSGCAREAVGSCGFQLNHTVNVATSTDLVNWHFHGTVLPSRPPGILFAPWVAQSNATGLYVLWFNMLPVVNGSGDFLKAYYAVGSSPSPLGPFRIVNANVTGLNYTMLPDSASVLVDDDGKGYIAYTHEKTHMNHVQELTPDLYGPLPNGSVSDNIGEPGNEGMVMMKRGGWYYVMFGPCCCFCSAGADVTAYMARSPLGPYALAGTVITAHVWSAQTGTVWFTGRDWVLFGDRWQSAPDHIKAHDFSYWVPLEFSANGSIVGITAWTDNVTIEF